MFALKKISILFLFVFFSQQSFAFKDAVSDLVDDIGEGATELGEKAVEMKDKAKESAGIGATAAEIDANADVALGKLLKQVPAAAELFNKARAVLIYPKILKAGLGFGGQHGKGALRENGKTVAYYNTVAASYGLQIGGQSFGFAMFFMDDEALNYLKSSDGWEVGVGPSYVLVDEGKAKSMTTSTKKDSIYVFTFNQQGLMAGSGIQGSKITRIYPK